VGDLGLTSFVLWSKNMGCEPIKILPDAVLNPFPVLKESDRLIGWGSPSNPTIFLIRLINRFARAAVPRSLLVCFVGLVMPLPFCRLQKTGREACSELVQKISECYNVIDVNRFSPFTGENGLPKRFNVRNKPRLHLSDAIIKNLR